jgi:alkylated DNA repair dioxygenase AlkB
MDTAVAWQGSLFGAGPVEGDASFATATRHELAGGAWVDVVPGWVTGADDLFATLVRDAPWRSHRRHMYDRVVDEPRLRAPGWDHLPPVVDSLRSLLSARYGVEFTSVGLNLYRDGRDSVAWHGDRVARDLPEAVVAVLSLGGARRFLLRPTGGGASVRHELRAGDLLVMGGSCQRTWQHSVPKCASAEPRISVTFRHAYD